MIDFEPYFLNKFQKDLKDFETQIPIEGVPHHAEKEFTIQYFNLTPYYSYLDVIPIERQPYFVVALFWVVLVDQVFYSKFRNNYEYFNQHTHYPKFIGNCTAPSLMSSECGHHIHPKRILEAVNDFQDKGNREGFFREIYQKNESKSKRQEIDSSECFEQSKAIMKDVIMDYFDNHKIPDMFFSKEEFWDNCIAEI